MADKSKSAKLAAAKKRLKQFQSQHHPESETEQTQHTDPVACQDGSVSDQPSEQSGAEDSSAIPDQPTVPIATLLDMLSAQIEKPKQVDGTQVDLSLPYQTPAATGRQIDDLEIERQRNHELSVQLLNQNTQIEQLRSQIQRLGVENSTKVTMEIGPLQQQLQSHVQTIGVLVGEKAELAAGLAKFQSLARQKITEVEELQGRLNASRHRVQTLERDISTAKTSSERIDETQQKLCSELESGQEQLKIKQRQLDDLTEECSELRRSLSRRTADTDLLNTQIHEIRGELSLAQLRVEQLTAGDGIHLDDSKIEQLAQQKISFERQVVELQQIVQQLGAERDQANQQYQNYVQTLSNEIAQLGQQLQTSVADNERLAQREESLIRHVGELERQMQQQMAKQKDFKKSHQEAILENHPEHAAWKERVDVLEREKSELNESILTRNQENGHLSAQLESAKSQLEHLEDMVDRLKSEQPDAKSLNASMESDKIAASRAVSQNLELKQQLEEIQRAFVQLSNDKLELTDRLQSEQHLGRENKNSVVNLQEQLDAIREKLHFKDEEMIRLSHENEEVKKESLQLTIEIDRLRHYESKVQTASIVQQQSDEQIRKLRNKISSLETTLSQAHIPNDSIETHQVDTSIPPENAASDIEDNSDVLSTSSSIKTIATEEAMDRLQERFKRTMSDHANLTEEKFRLEHLVLQLQDETNTIGDYIALYHKQRQLLKQREIEKDIQLKHIVQDREEMQTKLMQLNGLVEQLMRQQQVTTETGSVPSAPHMGNGNVIDLPPLDNSSEARLLHDSHPPLKYSSKTTATATQILHLLTEIQDKNQTLDNQPLPSMEKCACCYGQLKVV